MFKKILIANRGEIARRVIRTAQRMGIKTVAVYSEIDSDACHVREADEAVLIGGAPSNQSYLVMEKIIDAIRQTGAEAVHPGYGFLSEKPAFAAAVKAAGAVFIGPPSTAIAAMGDKIESKKLAQKAGVTTVPGYLGTITDEAQALRIAKEIGYPVIVKASAGGGGKGMRIAWNEQQLSEGLRLARSEAKNSFADDRVFLEKYIQQPRHIEIQILADQHGKTLYLGERECSIQRRHQKVIEECPSPFLDEKTRRMMGEQAVGLAKAVGYQSAGTVEFVVDPQRNFYFLEMNTRLQVEHPVTELVLGLDLVEWMIRIAHGEKIPFTQQDIRMKGWAIEARFYAEDPQRGFLPSIGRLTHYLQPPTNKNIRVDSGVDEGSEISVYYDPMIAKVCSYGDTRTEAAYHLRQALDRFVVRGISHNALFLSNVLGKQKFIEGKLSTAFIQEEFPEGFHVPSHPVSMLPALTALASVLYYLQECHIDPSLSQFGILSDTDDIRLVVFQAKQQLPVTINRSHTSKDYQITINQQMYSISLDLSDTKLLLMASINQQPVVVQVEYLGNNGYRLSSQGAQTDFHVYLPHIANLMQWMPERKLADRSKMLSSPMPGMLTSLTVKEGEEVKIGQELLVLEAMKMENIIRAERNGKIKKIHAKAGETLAVDQMILEFE